MILLIPRRPCSVLLYSIISRRLIPVEGLGVGWAAPLISNVSFPYAGRGWARTGVSPERHIRRQAEHTAPGCRHHLVRARLGWGEVGGGEG